MLPEIVFLTDIKKQIEAIPCISCQTKLTFKSVEFDEDFECGEDATVAVDAYCKKCHTYPAVLVQINT